MDESDFLVARAALASPEVAVAAWQEWWAKTRIEDASGLLVWAGGYIHRNLQTAGLSDPYLAGIARHNFLANNRKLIAARPMLMELTSRWELTPLKSFGMTHDQYSRGMRPLADFDFYVDESHTFEVEEFLRSNEFAAMTGATRHEFASRIVPQRGSWNFLSGGVDLDLHWRLLEHLSVGESRALIERHSKPDSSEVGPIRRLSTEMMLVCVAVHFELQPDGPLSGLFALTALTRRADTDAAARLAIDARAVRDVAVAVERIRDILGDDRDERIDAFADALRPAAATRPFPNAVRFAPRIGERIPRRYVEPARLRFPRLYALWMALTMRPSLERLLIRLTGGMAAPESAVTTEGGAPLPAGGGKLANGWHYLYPGDTRRWAHAPDARLVFDDVAGDVRWLEIELDEPDWNASPPLGFGVFVNGRHVGDCRKGERRYRFALPAREDRLEVSLRVTSWQRHIDPGIHEKWYRMLAPVKRVELA